MKRIIRHFIDLAMVLCLIALSVITLTGGYEGEVFGSSFSATTPTGAIKAFLLLLLVRFFLSVKLADSLLLLISLVVSLAAAELVLRIWDAPITKHQLVQIHRASPVSGWDLIPGARGVSNTGALYEVNANGCRDHEYSASRSSEMTRALVLGDSFTFGMGVNLEDTYPKQLERLLNASGQKTEIINCGVIGHDMWQHHATLDAKADIYQPDLVILGIYYNDLQSIVRPAEAKRPNYKGENPFQKEEASARRHRSALYNTIRNVEDLLKYRFRSSFGANHVKGLVERKKLVGPTNPTDRHYRIMAGKHDSEFYADFARSLAEFAVAVDKHGADLLVVMIPDAVQLHDPHMQFVNRKIEQACSDAGIAYLDTTPFLEKYETPEALYLFPDDAHNNALGLGIIARAISDKLTDGGISTAAQ